MCPSVEQFLITNDNDFTTAATVVTYGLICCHGNKRYTRLVLLWFLRSSNWSLIRSDGIKRIILPLWSSFKRDQYVLALDSRLFNLLPCIKFSVLVVLTSWSFLANSFKREFLSSVSLLPLELTQEGFVSSNVKRKCLVDTQE